MLRSFKPFKDFFFFNLCVGNSVPFSVVFGATSWLPSVGQTAFDSWASFSVLSSLRRTTILVSRRCPSNSPNEHVFCYLMLFLSNAERTKISNWLLTKDEGSYSNNFIFAALLLASKIQKFLSFKRARCPYACLVEFKV